MNRLAGMLLVMLPVVASAQGVYRAPVKAEQVLTTAVLNASAAVNGNVGGAVVQTGRCFTVQRVTTHVFSGASGAGNTVIRLSDGTNNCDVTFSCTTDTNTAGPKSKAVTGACTFCGSAVTVSVQTAGCATTQPVLRSIEPRGFFN